MCSILGIFDVQTDVDHLRELALQLSKRQRHRGPDWSGVFHCERAVLAHERLSIVGVDSDIHPFALDEWVHALEEAHGRDARDADYSNRPLDIDIIYFGELVLEGPGDFQLPRPELHHAFVLKPLADIAPDFVDPIRNKTLAQLWAAHPRHRDPPAQVDVVL